MKTHDLPKGLLQASRVLMILSLLFPACDDTPIQTIEFSWEKIQTGLAPTARMDTALTTDEATGRIYMFGGRSKSGCLADFWYYTPDDGQGWHKISSDSGPSARSGASMVVDSKNGRLVLFGGYCSNEEGGLEFNREIWLFSDKDGWSRQYTKGGPAPRAWQSMSWDSKSSVLIFGGVTHPPSFHRNDLWRLDLDLMKWTRAANDGGPLMAGRSALLAGGQHPVTVFGRMGIRKAKTSATFRLEGINWKKLDSPKDQTSPAAFQLAFADNHTQSILLLRGPGEHSDKISWDLWLRFEPWNNNSRWLSGHSDSGPTFAHSMTCTPEPGESAFICFGGARTSEFSNETWRLKIVEQRGAN